MGQKSTFKMQGSEITMEGLPGGEMKIRANVLDCEMRDRTEVGTLGKVTHVVLLRKYL